MKYGCAIGPERNTDTAITKSTALICSSSLHPWSATAQHLNRIIRSGIERAIVDSQRLDLEIVDIPKPSRTT